MRYHECVKLFGVEFKRRVERERRRKRKIWLTRISQWALFIAMVLLLLLGDRL